MCFNWRVLAGLGAVGVGIFLFAPELAAAALPLLLLAACPISMLLMMKGMQGMGREHGNQSTAPDEQMPRAPDAGPTREEQLAQLKAQLQRVNEQQAAIARQVEQLEAAEAATPPSKALQEAEPIAQAAESRQ